MDSSAQRVGECSLSINDKFAGNAVQTINKGGAGVGTLFIGSALINLEDGGKSQNATFMDNSSAMIAPTA